MDKETLRYLKIIENIDFSYFALSEINSQLSLIKSTSGINAMIDKATGFREEKIKELKDATIHHLKIIIRNKKKIGVDCSSDEDMMRLLKTQPTQNEL